MNQRNWKCNWRKSIVAPSRNQIWRFIWDEAMSKITPDKKSQINSKGEFLTECKAWDYSYDDEGNRFRCKTYKIFNNLKNTMGHDRGRQVALGRALGYNKNPIRTFTSSDPGMGVYSGWNKGSKPKGNKAKKLLDIAGFEDFSHAMFVWAGAGKKYSPVSKEEPLKRFLDKDLIKICEDVLDKNLGDVCDCDSTQEEIYEEANTLILDALADSGCTMNRAFVIATKVLKGYK